MMKAKLWGIIKVIVGGLAVIVIGYYVVLPFFVTSVWRVDKHEVYSGNVQGGSMNLWITPDHEMYLHTELLDGTWQETKMQAKGIYGTDLPFGLWLTGGLFPPVMHLDAGQKLVLMELQVLDRDGTMKTNIPVEDYYKKFQFVFREDGLNMDGIDFTLEKRLDNWSDASDYFDTSIWKSMSEQIEKEKQEFLDSY